MTETEIIKSVTTITARKETREIINAFLSCVREALKDGEQVKLKDIGTLKVVTPKPSKRRNPRTGEVIEVAEKRTVKFKASPNFIKNILNGGKEA